MNFRGEAWGENGGGSDWNEKHIVYIVTVPFSHHQYIGETILGLKERMETHIRETLKRGGKQKMDAKLREFRVHNGVWVPIVTWPQGASEYTRLFFGAQHIWTRDRDLNKLGTRTWRDRGDLQDGELVGSKRRRLQMVMRFVEMLRSLARIGVRIEEKEPEKRKGRTVKELKERGSMLSLMARLARRPLHKRKNFNELGVIKRVRAL